MPKFSEVDRIKIIAEGRANIERLTQKESEFRYEREMRAQASGLLPGEGDAIDEPQRPGMTPDERRAFDEWFKGSRQPEPQRAAPQPTGSDPWAAWNHWADTKIAQALAIERQAIKAELLVAVEGLSEGIADLLAKERKAMKNNLAEEIKALRVEIMALKETMAELKKIANSDGAKIIDLPNPRQKAN
jgi:hypothetical protein